MPTVSHTQPQPQPEWFLRTMNLNTFLEVVGRWPSFDSNLYHSNFSVDLMYQVGAKCVKLSFAKRGTEELHEGPVWPKSMYLKSGSWCFYCVFFQGSEMPRTNQKGQYCVYIQDIPAD